jgi:hypothetical protein
MAEIRSYLQAHPMVTSVQVNDRSGSVLVEGERNEVLRSALEELFNVVAETAGQRETDATVQLVVDLVKRADARVSELTEGKLSIRWLVPVSFITVALRQLLRQGLTLGDIPWFVLLYYGVDSFLKLYPEHAPNPQKAVLLAAVPPVAARRRRRSPA